jgi:hypothetical protein
MTLFALVAILNFRSAPNSEWDYQKDILYTTDGYNFLSEQLRMLFKISVS